MKVQTLSLAALLTVSTATVCLARQFDCSGWSATTLSDFAHAADRGFNRDRKGEPILFGLTQAAWLIDRYRWSDASHGLSGFDHSFWLIAGHGGKRVPAVVGQIIVVLHHCVLGPDYSMGPEIAMSGR